MNVTIRQAVSADTETCGRIIYDAFENIADRHGFPPHFPALETAIQRANFSITHLSIFGVVAESDGQIIGSNFLDEPVTVDWRVQIRGIGRRLMETAPERARGAVGVRLVRDSFRIRGKRRKISIVRPLQKKDLGECAALCGDCFDSRRCSA